MSKSSKLIFFSAFACLAACLAGLAAPALLGGGLAVLGGELLGWEAGAAVPLVSAAVVAWLYLRRRRRAARGETPERAP